MSKIAAKLNTSILSTRHSLIRTGVFTSGHFVIDMLTNYFITGAPIHLIALSAILSPTLNAVWYYILDRFLFCHILQLNIKKVGNIDHS